MSIMIGIDHGYYAIKTAHCSFPAGLTSYGEHEPHPPRTLRVWRVLFCLWLWAAAYPEGQNCERQLLPADTGSHCKRNPAAQFAARMFCADCGWVAADQLPDATSRSSAIICCEVGDL